MSGLDSSKSRSLPERWTVRLDDEQKLAVVSHPNIGAYAASDDPNNIAGTVLYWLAVALVRSSETPSETKPRDVEWVVNSLGELGVKIGDDFQWMYKGRSLRYEDPTHEAGEEREGKPMLWRRIGKREFGECCHPINYEDPTKWGTVDVNDGMDWKPIPPSKHEGAV
jgi:hypothetical protein